jgi:hypothetical protein
MKYQEDYIQLSDRISWKNVSLVSNILNKNIDLDLTYNEGEFFTLAIENNSVEIIKTLLDYFNENHLSKYTSGSTEYLLLKNKMRDILEVAIEDVSLSEEMKEMLSPYIDFEGSEHGTINDFLDDYQESDGVYLSHQIDTPPMRKSHSTDDIKNYSKESHSTHEHSDEELLVVEKVQDLELIKFKNDLGVGGDFHQENLESEIVGNFKDFHQSD